MPYAVEKVNMNCYGDKPPWFWAMQPSGGIPVAKLGSEVIRESNDIIMAIERAFPERPLIPSAESEPDAHARVQPLLSLERELFSSWFRWLTSSMSDGAQRVNFEALLRRVDGELGVAGGPYFLGKELSVSQPSTKPAHLAPSSDPPPASSDSLRPPCPPLPAGPRFSRRARMRLG